MREEIQRKCGKKSLIGVGDETGVVAHVDDDGFLGVGVGLETDKCLLACHGLQICGAAFLLVPTLIISILLVSFCR